MRYEVLAVTGVRPFRLPPGGEERVRARLKKALEGFREQGGRRLLQGGCIGVDQWAAQAALEAGVEVTTFVPFPQQAEGWSPQEREAYEALLQRGEVRTFGASFSKDLYFARNRALVEEADLVLAVLTGASGGSAWTARCARQQGEPLLLLRVTEEGLRESFLP